MREVVYTCLMCLHFCSQHTYAACLDLARMDDDHSDYDIIQIVSCTHPEQKHTELERYSYTAGFLAVYFAHAHEQVIAMPAAHLIRMLITHRENNNLSFQTNQCLAMMLYDP